jgi:anti-sigma B factor antagonist
MNLSATTSVLGGNVVVALAGDVDLSTIPMLQDALRKALAFHPDHRLVIDLDGVVVLDDVGLGVLLGVAGSVRRGGSDVTVVTNNERLRQRLEITGFSRAIEVHSRASG